MSFAEPYLLLTLLAVPLAAAGYVVLERGRSRRSQAWTRQALLPNITRRPSRRLRYVPAVLFLLGLTFLLVGFARPQRIHASPRVGAPTIVLTFDVSGSMAADDARPTRLRAARALATRFLDELPATYRVAVVTFADKVRLAVPPTFDHRRAAAGIPTAITPLGASALGDGITFSVATAVTAAGESEAGALPRPGAVLLFSDGAQTGGGTTPAEAAVSALVDYIPINTVAFGTKTGIVTQPATVNGVRTSTQISVPVQPATLRTVAKETRGTFFDGAAATAQPDTLRSVYRDLRPPPADAKRATELSAAAGAIALVFILAGIALSGLWFGRPA